MSFDDGLTFLNRARFPVHMLACRVFPAHRALKWVVALLVATMTGAITPRHASGQFIIPVPKPYGVYLKLDGTVNSRQVDEKDELAAMRARVKATEDVVAKGERLVYISLPKLFAEVRSLRAANKPIPDELRFLHGLTQLRYVIALPEEKDLLIAGPCEPWRVLHAEDDACEYVVGTRTGHPVLQLDDLIVGLRTAREGGGNVFGCSINPPANAIQIADDIKTQMSRNTRAERMAAMRERFGPMDISIFGCRKDTRFSYICVAADYELKRYTLNLDHAPIAHLPSAVETGRAAACKFWFQADYEPLLAAKDHNAFQIRGQRIAVECGAFDFDPRGATKTQQNFAHQFTKQVPLLATAVPLFAELQNISDEALLGNLILHDKLTEKVAWDDQWIYDDAACPVAKIPTPKFATTLVNYSSGAIVAGGVTMVLAPYVDEPARQVDEKEALAAERKRLAAMNAADKAIFRFTAKE